MASKRIAVVGGGPIGIEAALYGCSLGHEVMLLERGELAANVAAWGFMRLFTPWCMNTTPLGMCMLGKDKRCSTKGLEHLQPDCYMTGAQLRQAYLLPLTHTALMEGVVRERTTVLSIGREDRANGPFRLMVRDRAGKE